MVLIAKAQIEKIPQLKNQDDAYLEMLVQIASESVKSYLKRDIEQQTYTEYYSGDNQPRLILRQRPVSSITSIHVDHGGFFGQGDGAFPASSLLTEGSDYALQLDYGGSTSRSGIVERLGTTGSFISQYPENQFLGKLAGSRVAIWPRGQGNIKVVYLAGYTVIPKAIQAACMLMVAVLARTLPIGGNITSESLGGYSYSLGSSSDGDKPEMGTIRQLLSRYREVSF